MADVKQAVVDQISEFFEKSGNPAASALFNTINQGLSKPQQMKRPSGQRKSIIFKEMMIID